MLRPSPNHGTQRLPNDDDTIIIICIICTQFVNNCLQYYNELCVCGNLMRNTHSIGRPNKYFSYY